MRIDAAITSGPDLDRPAQGTAPRHPQGTEPDLILLGEKAGLGPLRRDLARDYARWMNQMDVRLGLDRLGLATPETEDKWAEECIKEGGEQEPKTVEFTIYDRTDGAPVGTAGLFGIGHAHGTARYGIALGERRGRGLGTDATRLVLSYGFDLLHLHNVMLEVLEWNVAGLTAYERAGFRRIGVRRSAVTSRGKRTNLVLMDAVPHDISPALLS